MDETERHLDLLAIGHYVVAGLTALLACLPILHFGIGLVMGLRQQWFGLFLAALSGAMIAIGFAWAICTLVAGRRLAQRRSHTFCIVIAGLNCTLFPFGTVLGVFTLLVLLKPEVKVRFNGAPLPTTAVTA